MLPPPKPPGPDVNIGPSALIIIWVFIAFATVFVLARLWSQAIITRNLGLSDTLMAASLVTVLSLGSIFTVQYHYGWGRHSCYLSKHDQTQAAKWNLIGSSFGIMASTFGRMSFIVTMVQLFGTSPLRRRVLWTLFAAQILVNGGASVCLYTQCSKVQMTWNPSYPHRDCWDPTVRMKIGYGHSSLNAATDVFLTCLPAVMLWKLQMKPRLKVGLAVLLGLSIFACVACIFKMIKLTVFAYEADQTYTKVSLDIWIAVEACLVMVAASAPLLRPLFASATWSKAKSSSKDSYEMRKATPHQGSDDLECGNSVSTYSDGRSVDQLLPDHHLPEGANHYIVKEVRFSVHFENEGTIDSTHFIAPF